MILWNPLNYSCENIVLVHFIWNIDRYIGNINLKGPVSGFVGCIPLPTLESRRYTPVYGTLSMKIDDIVDSSRILDEIVDSSQWLDENVGYFYCW